MPCALCNFPNIDCLKFAGRYWNTRGLRAGRILQGVDYRATFNALLVASEACGLRIQDLQGLRFNLRHASLDLGAFMSTLRQRSSLSKLSSLSLGFALPVDGNFNKTHFCTRMASGLNQLTQLKSLCLWFVLAVEYS